MKLSESQRWVLERMAAGEKLRWNVQRFEIGHEPVYLQTKRSLYLAGYISHVVFTDDRPSYYEITTTGRDALARAQEPKP